MNNKIFFKCDCCGKEVERMASQKYCLECSLNKQDMQNKHNQLRVRVTKLIAEIKYLKEILLSHKHIDDGIIINEKLK